ncbi:MAG: DUF2892 domain-containing protein [Armatimonadota bacterium]|nr:DUF2892 domain-containing protein [Armatimonadota bacterium]MDR7440399.1 DUF2892 domain-containing protein [Armatimonadota bacterium]MDR7568362.1 DUF2892 domain-containing protein [Armatimonadota bacterium]MDR7602524.1 DUF2892 domain-containing protein [Armatimonadota bacterium]
MRGCTGTTDRVVRIVVGLVALAVGLQRGGSALGYVLYAVAAVGLVTGIVGRCPLYALLGLQTCGQLRR